MGDANQTSLKRLRPLFWALVALGGVAGAASAWIVPPMRVPDEAGHWVAGLNRIHAALGGSMPLCSTEIALSEHFGHAPPFRREPFPAHSEPACGSYEISYGGLLTYPQLWAAHLVHLAVDPSPIFTLRLARLLGGLWVMLACAVAVGSIQSLSTATGLAWVLAMVLSPIGIQQSFGVSMDGGVIAFCVMLASLILSGAEWGRASWGLFLATGVVALQSKPVFAPLLLIYFLLPEVRARAPRGMGVWALALFSYGIWNGLASRATSISAAHADADMQKLHVAAHPFASGWLVAWTTLKRAVVPTQWMIARMGWGEYVSSLLTQAFYFSSLICIAAGARFRRLNWRDGVFALLWLGSASLVTLFLYLVWTPAGGSSVEGLQGRYFVPYQIVLGAYVFSRINVHGSERALRVAILLQLCSVLSVVMDALRGYRL